MFLKIQWLTLGLIKQQRTIGTVQRQPVGLEYPQVARQPPIRMGGCYHQSALPRTTQRVVYPPLAKMVCPVIHQPSVTRNRTIGTISLMSVNRPFRLWDLWYATASGDSAG